MDINTQWRFFQFWKEHSDFLDAIRDNNFQNLLIERIFLLVVCIKEPSPARPFATEQVAYFVAYSLRGTIVYNASAEGFVYCYSRRDGKDFCAYLIINNDLENAVSVELPGDAELYALAGRDDMRSSVMTLNGVDLVAGPQGKLPELTGIKVSGQIEIAPGNCSFIVV